MYQLRITHYALSIVIIALCAMMTSCDGVLDGLYDEPPEVTADDMGFHGSEVTVDATSYTHWVYIDLRGKTVETRSLEAPEPEHWDIAVHRYDARTNGGAASETPYKDLSQVTTLDIANAAWTPDTVTSDRLMTDLSGMLTGDIKYAEGPYNPCLSRWLDLDLSVMPPIYTPSERVYLVRLADGTAAALRLAAYKSAQGRKGIMTIQYVCPL